MTIKAYIITMVGRDVSESLARECEQSCRDHNIEPRTHPAVWGDDVDLEMKKYGLSIFPKIKESRMSKGVKGCFLSHFQLWKQCFETNTPLLILEHDALIVKNISETLFTLSYGVLHLDSNSRTIEDYEAHLSLPVIPGIRKFLNEPVIDLGFNGINKSSIKGLHSYIIQPSGAKDLIEFTYKNGILPADIAVNSISCDLWITNSSLCRVNPRFWIPEKRKSKNSYTRTEV